MPQRLEVWRVPTGWKHPKNKDKNVLDDYQEISQDYFLDLFSWQLATKKFRIGFIQSRKKVGKWLRPFWKNVSDNEKLPFWLREKPDPKEYIPTFMYAITHNAHIVDAPTVMSYQLYEEKEPAHPVSPQFETMKELAHWTHKNYLKGLYENEDKVLIYLYDLLEKHDLSYRMRVEEIFILATEE